MCWLVMTSLKSSKSYTTLETDVFSAGVAAS